jgi:undecaprenyl-diphosphatase
MDQHRLLPVLPRLMALDLALCLRWNLAHHRRLTRGFFAGVSRAGDGPLWFSLVVILPALYGAAGWATVAEQVVVAAIALPVSRFLKARTGRPRPYVVEPSIELGAVPLDRFSFPSGHTLHAVALTFATCANFPMMGWVLVPFAALIALSRVVLGLHYPSDVVAGAGIGASVAALVGLLV